MPTGTEQLNYVCGTDGCKYQDRPTRTRWCAACGMPNDPSSGATGLPPLEDPQGRPWTGTRRAASRSRPSGPWFQDGRGTGPLAVGVSVLLVVGLWVGTHRSPGQETSSVSDYGQVLPADPFPATSETTETTAAPDTTDTTLGTPVELTSEATARASDTARSRKDAAGNVVRYSARNVLDGDPETAWRVEGDGAGVRFRLTLPASAHLTEVGLIPGYAKVDPDDGTDRFYQGNRILLARWTFDDGTSVDQRFDDEPTMQRQEVDAVTKEILLEILEVRRGDAGYDLTAISDVTVSGVLDD